MAYPYVCRRTTEVTAQGVTRLSGSSEPAVRRTLGLDDYEFWRARLMRLVFLPIAVLVTYWSAWLWDRGLVASDHSAAYVSFEQAFPLADAWLLAAMLLALLALRARRPSALLWLVVTGGAGGLPLRTGRALRPAARDLCRAPGRPRGARDQRPDARAQRRAVALLVAIPATATRLRGRAHAPLTASGARSTCAAVTSCLLLRAASLARDEPDPTAWVQP